MRVTPRSGRAAIEGHRDGVLLIRLTAPPADGKANEQLVGVLSGALGVPKRSIEIVAGNRTRNKRVRIQGISAADVTAKLSTT